MVRTDCRNCGSRIIRIGRAPWLHDVRPIPIYYGQRGCRAATFDGTGWDDSLPRDWCAEPKPGPYRIAWASGMADVA
jgi:hypothetical protein